jgi:hypothetical protein
LPAELVSQGLAAKGFVQAVDGAELQEEVVAQLAEDEGVRRSMVGAPANLFGLYRALRCQCREIGRQGRAVK